MKIDPWGQWHWPLVTSTPEREILEETRSIKVKRLFFYFADRHQAQWLDRIDRASIDLGKGKRMIAKGGKLDPKYPITVPEEMDALQESMNYTLQNVPGKRVLVAFLASKEVPLYPKWPGARSRV